MPRIAVTIEGQRVMFTESQFESLKKVLKRAGFNLSATVDINVGIQRVPIQERVQEFDPFDGARTTRIAAA